MLNLKDIATIVYMGCLFCAAFVAFTFIIFLIATAMMHGPIAMVLLILFFLGVAFLVNHFVGVKNIENIF